MTHPEELLAGYVDDTLEPPERAVVDAHLAGCDRCRDEVELASGARMALAALEDAPVPYGLTDRVVAEASRSFERRSERKRVVWERLQWAGGLAAAAAIVLVVVLNVGGEQREPTAESAATGATSAVGAAGAEDATAESGLPPFQGLEDQADVDYDETGVKALARDTARAIAAEAAPPAALFASPDEALACVTESGGPVDDPNTSLVRLVRAEYEGTPAYLAVFAEGPGAQQPASTIVVWIAAEDGCRLLHAASLRF
ncbi:MAG: zf-HC2 domain-containing protein [Actinobacteria bacterium]|nr:zf-HC2 domain-containing protein [Actinomycetota bacterium]